MAPRNLEELSRLSKDERFPKMEVGARIAVDFSFDEATAIAGMLSRRYVRGYEAVAVGDKVFVRRRR